MSILSLHFAAHAWLWAAQLVPIVSSFPDPFSIEEITDSSPTGTYTDYFPTETYTAIDEIQTHTITVGKVCSLLLITPDQYVLY